MIKLKQLLIVLINVSFFLALSTAQLFGQSCTKTANIPPNGSFSVNGVTVNSASTGAVTDYWDTYSVCGLSSSITMDQYPLWVGYGTTTANSSPWQTTLTFSKPVNNIVVLLSSTGSVHNEIFRFTSNNGTISIANNGSCFSTISGNTIISGQGSSSTNTGGGGVFTLSSPTPFTQLVMSGDGGDNGSMIAICEASIKESCIGTVDSDGDGKPDDCDLDDDNDGILDTAENSCNLTTSTTWSGTASPVTGTNGSGVTANNITMTSVATTGANTSFTASPNGAFNTTNFWSNSAVAGANSLQFVHTWDTTPEDTQQANVDGGTRTFTITFAKPVNKAIIHLDRLGGNYQIPPANYFSNSTEFTLTSSGISMKKLAGNNQLIVTGNKFYRSVGDDLGSVNPGTEANNTNGTAAGSIEFSSATGQLFNSLTFTVIGQGIEGSGNDGMEFIIESCIGTDTDGDGIPNHLDLDSDGDGCSDAIEGAGNFNPTTTASGTLSTQIPNINFGTSVDTNGIPQVVGASGQAVGQSQDATKNDCLDSDGDGYPNWQDLDDDNDGILDTDECVLTNLVTNGNFDANLTPDWTNDGGWTYNATGKYAENISSSFNEPYGSLTQLVSNLPPSTIPVKFTLGAKNNGTSNTSSLKIILNGVVYATVNNTAATTDNITLTLSNGATSDFTTFTAGTSYVSKTFTVYIPYTGPKSASLAFKKGGNELDHWYIDNVSILTCDNDVDGIPNDLDLDSDGDGCPDAIEGAGNFNPSTTASGTFSTQTPNINFGTSVDTNGIPQVVGASGQAVGQSQDATKNDCLDSDNDGYPNWSDLDDDNDGILDTDECPNVTIVNNGTFTSPVTEWTLSTGWDLSTGVAKNENDNVNSNLSQTLNNLNATNGVVKLSFTLGAQDGFNNGGYVASLNVILNGTTYATFNNGSVRTLGTNNVTQTLAGGATSTFTPFSTALISGYTTQNVTITIPYTGPNSATLTFNHSAGYDDWSIDNVSIDTSICDLDGDGISNELDLDSDGDGCPDALEGGAAFTTSDLQNSSMSGGNSGAGYIGTPISVTQNLGNTVGNTPSTMGVPTIAGTGQTVNNATNSFVNDCITTSCPPDPYAAQKSWWLSSSGDKVRIDFQTGSPVLNNPSTGFLGQGVIGDGQEGNTTVTHPVTGELLFVTDGSNVYRASDGAKATGYAGGSTTSAEAAAVIPDPQGILGRDFIIFGNSATSSFGAITRAKYNLETNTIHSKVTYLAGSTTEALEVIPHTNGTDYWVLVTTSDQKTKSFLYSKTLGFNTTPVSSIDVPYAENSATNSFISWDPRIPGKVLIARQNKVGLANFNPSTGVLGTWQVYITVNNPIAWTSYVTGYGAALSPNGRYIYYQQHDQPNNRMYLKYYDLINKTTTTLDYTIGLTAATKIAPDGKLYRIGYVGPAGSSIRQLFYINADANTPPATAGSQVQFDTGGRQVSLQLPNNTYWACITCQSGTAAPALASTNITSNPATVGDLIALLSASNQPAGTVITIHSGTPATDANKLANSTAIVQGTTYYAAFYDGLAICYSPTTAVSVKPSTLTDITCSNNGTFENSTDDFLQFKITPATTANYSVTATYNGSPVSVKQLDNSAATNIMGGFPSHFKVANGTLPVGNNFVITITPTTGTSETLTFTNTGTCSTACTSASSGNTVTYYYYSPVIAQQDSVIEPALLPKFDQSNGRLLTNVSIEYGANYMGGAIIESTAATSQLTNYQESSINTFNISGYTLNRTVSLFNTGLVTIPAGISVPAQGSWLGDVNGRTMDRMLISPDANWLNNLLLVGQNPSSSANWVTNITGNPTHDDDMIILNNSFIPSTNTVNYSAQADLNNFIGTGNLSSSFSNIISTSLAGSANLSFTQRLARSYFYKVTYTYDCGLAPTSCYKPAVTDGNTYPTKHGITSLGRAGTDSDNWPMVRQSAWTALESKTKGFVINRVKFNTSNQPVADNGTTLVITDPVEGMMVYDTTNNCLKVYTTTDGTTFAWHCMTTQACPN